MVKKFLRETLNIIKNGHSGDDTLHPNWKTGNFKSVKVIP